MQLKGFFGLKDGDYIDWEGKKWHVSSVSVIERNFLMRPSRIIIRVSNEDGGWSHIDSKNDSEIIKQIQKI